MVLVKSTNVYPSLNSPVFFPTDNNIVSFSYILPEKILCIQKHVFVYLFLKTKMVAYCIHNSRHLSCSQPFTVRERYSSRYPCIQVFGNMYQCINNYRINLQKLNYICILRRGDGMYKAQGQETQASESSLVFFLSKMYEAGFRSADSILKDHVSQLKGFKIQPEFSHEKFQRGSLLAYNELTFQKAVVTM